MIDRQDKNRRAGKNFKKVRGNKKPLYLWIGGIAFMVAIILVSLGYVPFLSREGEKGKSFYVQGGETRPALDPQLFTGLAKSAYTAAKEYPKVLDQFYCYCSCDQPPVNHKSLLSCFTDRHGEG
jgi:hypothetical protein